MQIRAVICAAVAIGAVSLSAVSGASRADAADLDPSQFHGVNWARLGDNFYGGNLVLHGLSGSDNYTTIKAKADAVYRGFRTNLGANTVRLPINTYTTGSAWWNSYTGAIDSALGNGFNVVLSYWDDGVASKNSKIVNKAAFDAMWNTAIAKYGSTSQVYFEPMNEPGGHSTGDWANVVATWISDRPSLARNRIFVSGAGLNADIKSMCADHRLDGTYLSLHTYTFFTGAKSYDEWVRYTRDAVGNCAGRTVIDEFGAPMDTGLNYNDANSTDNFVRYFRATTQVIHDLHLGSVYWPGLGGKNHNNQGDDWYAMQKLHGTGTNLTLTTPSTTGADRLRYAWNASVPPSSSTPTPSPSPTTVPPTTVPPTTVPPATGACRVTAAVNAWNSGLTETITITNTGTTAVNGWSLAFDLPAGQSITSGWNATYTPTTGRVVATNAAYNAAIAPNASVSIGFQANHTGNAAAPASFTLNGAACGTS
jgi:Cellulose binding domain/Cellulase (glycosyl hydrolase family 5)